MHPDDYYMTRCIELAKKGSKNTKSNPLVGALLEYNGRILGEGYHRQYGQNHAEINAIESVADGDRHLLPFSTIYVSLEPCSHLGKTPPCADKIINAGIKKVVIGCLDPNPMVSGRGVDLLRSKGVDVKVPVMEQDATELIAKFKANLSGYPYVILKWAQSRDNYMTKNGEQTWLSNKYSGILVHKWRTENDAILIGKNTATVDNPKLNVRHYSGQDPIRVLLDTNLQVDIHSHLFSDQKPTIVINIHKNEVNNNVKYLKITDTRNISDVLQLLFNFGVYSIIVEGGFQILRSFIDHNVWHEARIIKTSQLLFNGISSPDIEGKLFKRTNLDGDEILYIKNTGNKIYVNT